MGALAIDDVAKLKRSSQGRAGTPDGNIFFDTANGILEIITADELAQVDLGSGLEANPLTLDSKPTLRAIYELQQAERESDVTFQRHDPFVKGRFKLGKAFDFIYGRNAGTDRTKIAGSGWREFTGAVGTNINRIYFNVSTLKSVLDTSQVYGQLTADSTTFDFARLGAVDEAFQVFGTTAFGDATAGDFDSRSYLAVSVSTYGQRHQRIVLGDFGVSELEGYGTLAALGEAPHPTTNNYTKADVYGGSQIAPFTTLAFDVLSVAETKTGFNEADGDFTYVIRNTAGAGLDQVIAWLDVLNDTDADVSNTANPWNGKQKDALYTYDAEGIPNFIDGVFIENLPASDLQRLKIVDDAGNPKTFPFVPEVRVSIPTAAQNTSTGKYIAFILDGNAALDYNTDAAVILNDSNASPVQGAIGASTLISFGIPYDTFSQAGLTAPVDFAIRFMILSDGEFEESFVDIDITRTALIPASLTTSPENNI